MWSSMASPTVGHSPPRLAMHSSTSELNDWALRVQLCAKCCGGHRRGLGIVSVQPQRNDVQTRITKSLQSIGSYLALQSPLGGEGKETRGHLWIRSWEQASLSVMAEAEFTPDCSDGDFHRKIADGGVDRVYGREKTQKQNNNNKCSQAFLLPKVS